MVNSRLIVWGNKRGGWRRKEDYKVGKCGSEDRNVGRNERKEND